MVTTILNQLSIWIIVIPFLVGMMNYKSLDKDSKWILLVVTAGIVPQVMSFFIKGENPLLNRAYNIYIPIELMFFALIFLSKFNGIQNRRIIYLSVLINFAIFFYTSITSGLNSFHNNLVCVNNITYMLWVFLLLKQEYNAEHTVIEKSNPFTWYLIAIILYAPCTVVTFSLYYYFRNSDDVTLKNLYVIHSVFNIFLYLLFSVGLLIRKPQKKFS